MEGGRLSRCHWKVSHPMRLRAAMSLLICLSLAACGDKLAEPSPKAELPPGTTLIVKRQSVEDIKQVAAVVTTRNQAAARARINGTLQQLLVREGDLVEKGQRIALVTDSRLGFEASSMTARVAAAKAELDRAMADYQRVKSLFADNVYAKTRMDQAEATAQSAKAQYEAAQSEQQASRDVVEQGAVLAPESGRVLEASVPAGSVVTAGTAIALITAGNPVLRLELPESLAGGIRPGSIVTLVDDPLPGSASEGRITEIYPAVTAGRVTMDATVDGLSDAIIGKRVTVGLAVARRDVIEIPRTYLTTRFGVDVVELVTPDNRTLAVPVQAAVSDRTDQVEILSGVREGDVLFARSEAP